MTKSIISHLIPTLIVGVMGFFAIKGYIEDGSNMMKLTVSFLVFVEVAIIIHFIKEVKK